MKMAQNKRLIQGLERMVWWWWWRGVLLVKVEKLPGKHLVIAIVKKKKKKSSALWKAIPRHTAQSEYLEQLQAG